MTNKSEEIEFDPEGRTEDVVAELEKEKLQGELAALMQEGEDRAFAKFVGAVQALKAKKPAVVEPEPEPRNLPPPPTPKRGEGNRGSIDYGEMRDARDYQYARLFRTHPELRGYRNPKTDVEMARWIRAITGINRDIECLIEWEQRDREAIKRADLLDGATTAVSGLSQGTAGSFIPLPLHNQINLLRDRAAVIRPFCRVVTSPALTLRVPKAGVATVAMANEGAVAAQGEPTNGSVLLTKRKMQAVFQASEESLQDSAFNVVSFFTERAGSAMGYYEDLEICTANASSTPTNGSLNFTGSLETPNDSLTILNYAEATSTVITYADMMGMWFGIGKQYRRSATWLMSTATLAIVSGLDDANGRPIFAPAGSPGLPVSDVPGATGVIFGCPVLEVPLTAGYIFIADMSYYYILEGERMSMKTTDAASWTADTIDFKLTSRIDGALISNGTAGNSTARVCSIITSAA